MIFDASVFASCVSALAAGQAEARQLASPPVRMDMLYGYAAIRHDLQAVTGRFSPSLGVAQVSACVSCGARVSERRRDGAGYRCAYCGGDR